MQESKEQDDHVGRSIDREQLANPAKKKVQEQNG
jgi:hypothetical protein